MDDTDADMSWHLNGRTMAQVPDRRVLARRDPQHARERRARRCAGPASWPSPNLYAPWDSDYDAQATWSDWLQFASGAAQEYYSKWGSASSGWFAGSDWTFRQQFQALTEQAGKIFLGITYAPHADARSMTCARANFLLFDEPANGGALMFEPSDPEAEDPYSPSVDGRTSARPSGRASRSARPGGATSPAAPSSSTRPPRR